MLDSLSIANHALVDFLRAEIKARGPTSFAWFMQQALYHPEHGYYSSGRAAIGRGGDYFTNVSVGPLFGGLLAAQFAEIWEKLGCPQNFTIVEQGAHEGELARDVLQAVRERAPEFSATLRYVIIEPFSVLRDRQFTELKQFDGKVQWCRSLEELEPFEGIHFSNELLDAMPVHLITSSGDGSREWRERAVGFDWNFFFSEREITDAELLEHVADFPVRPAGYTTEVNLAVLNWIDTLSTRLRRGFVIAIDYGFVRDEFYVQHRRAGTLQVRAQHRVLESPLENIGEADITAHVQWTSIAERAEARGFQIAGFTDQHHFITGIFSELGRGGSPEPPANANPSPGDWGQSPLPSPKTQRALQTLMHPEFLGTRFQVLGLARNADRTDLAGFAFARDARRTLGLN